MANVSIKYNFCLLISLFSIIVIIFAENEIVETTHGLVSGKILRTLIKDVKFYGFMGIPYAAPPVNKLRFLPPQEIEPWENVLTASKEKPACIQFNINIKKGQPYGNYGKEDCLYLDIYTPAPDNSKRATMVFLHNYNLKNSYNKSLEYAPDFFIEEDVIVVTISHRLSVFGFLSLEDDVLLGNAGLKDIVAGLQWVNNNIERFGGDRKRITLMGSQGGAAAVDLLIRTKAKELFNSAILQSDTSLMSAYLQKNVRGRAFKLGKLLDRPSSSSATLLKDLSEVPAEDLLANELIAISDDFNKEKQKPLLNFGPVVEKSSDGLVTEYPEDSSQKIYIPIMIGFNSREGLEPSLQYLLEPRFVGALEKDFPLIMPIRLKFQLDPLNDHFYEAIKEIKAFYFPEKTIGMDSVKNFITLIGDIQKSYPIDRTVRLYANVSERPIYYYHFDYYSDLNENKNSILKLSNVEDGTWGAATGDELCYLFKCPSLNQKYKKHHKTESEEMKIQKKLIKLWTNFAKYGEPTPTMDNPLNTQWSPYNLETKEYLHIGRQIEIKREIYKERLQFWENFLKKWEQFGEAEDLSTRDEL